jgi:hypothetical protein
MDGLRSPRKGKAIMAPVNDDLILKEWRTGRKLGRTIYAQVHGEEASDDDVLIGMMDTEMLAREVIEAHNRVLKGRYS